MATTTIIVIRVLCASTLGLIGLVCLMGACYLLAFRDFVLFGWTGAALIATVTIGVALLLATGRLFKTTLKLPAT